MIVEDVCAPFSFLEHHGLINTHFESPFSRFDATGSLADEKQLLLIHFWPSLVQKEKILLHYLIWVNRRAQLRLQ